MARKAWQRGICARGNEDTVALAIRIDWVVLCRSVTVTLLLYHAHHTPIHIIVMILIVLFEVRKYR